MANEFQSIQGGQGLLKNSYEPEQSPLSEALKKKRLKMSDTIQNKASEPEENEGQ